MGSRNIANFSVVETKNSFQDHDCYYGNISSLCGITTCCGRFFCTGCETSFMCHDGVLSCCNSCRIDFSSGNGEEYNADEEYNQDS